MRGGGGVLAHLMVDGDAWGVVDLRPQLSARAPPAAAESGPEGGELGSHGAASEDELAQLSARASPAAAESGPEGDESGAEGGELGSHGAASEDELACEAEAGELACRRRLRRSELREEGERSELRAQRAQSAQHEVSGEGAGGRAEARAGAEQGGAGR